MIDSTARNVFLPLTLYNELMDCINHKFASILIFYASKYRKYIHIFSQYLGSIEKKELQSIQTFIQIKLKTQLWCLKAITVPLWKY